MKTKTNWTPIVASLLRYLAARGFTLSIYSSGDGEITGGTRNASLDAHVITLCGSGWAQFRHADLKKGYFLAYLMLSENGSPGSLVNDHNLPRACSRELLNAWTVAIATWIADIAPAFVSEPQERAQIPANNRPTLSLYLFEKYRHGQETLADARLGEVVAEYETRYGVAPHTGVEVRAALEAAHDRLEAERMGEGGESGVVRVVIECHEGQVDMIWSDVDVEALVLNHDKKTFESGDTYVERPEPGGKVKVSAFRLGSMTGPLGGFLGGWAGDIKTMK